MEEYTREQIQRADDTDLYVFLSGRGEQFKRCGKEYRWLRHDSVMINKNEWYRFSQNKGGHAIDFMSFISKVDNGSGNPVCNLIRMRWIYFFNHS